MGKLTAVRREKGSGGGDGREVRDCDCISAWWHAFAGGAREFGIGRRRGHGRVKCRGSKVISRSQKGWRSESFSHWVDDSARDSLVIYLYLLRLCGLPLNPTCVFHQSTSSLFARHLDRFLRSISMLPFLQPTHEALVSPLLHTKLYLRRLRRRWCRDNLSRHTNSTVLHDDGSGPLTDSDSTSKTRHKHFALLPAIPPDAPPLPQSAIISILFVASLLVRAWDIAYPDSVVFDEVHFLRFVKAYYYGKYFFDIHPPLGKLILLLVTKLFCGPPHLENKMNGEQFGDQVYTPLRWCSALFGSTIAPTIYLIARELGLSFPAALIPAFAYVFEHLFVVESRLILMDSQLICFMSLCLLFALRLWGARKGTTHRLRYLLATALTGAAAISVKWTALATPVLVALVSLLGFPFPREGRLRWSEMLVAGGVAAVFYVSLFYVHFWLLPLSGEGDGFMPRKFRETLKGGKFYDPNASGPGFVRNFLYLNREMYSANARIKTRHHWESKWYQWIINQRGLLYFNEHSPSGEGGLDYNISRKVYLIVNPVVSVVTFFALIAFLIIALAVYLPRKRMRRLRKGSKLPAFIARGTFFFVAYTVNILPYLGALCSMRSSCFVIITFPFPVSDPIFDCLFSVVLCVCVPHY